MSLFYQTFKDQNPDQIKLSQKRKDGILIVSIEGELNYRNSETVTLELENIIADGVKDLILDLEGLLSIDSSGMSLLISLFKKLQTKKGKLAFLRPRQNVLKVIQSTNLTTIIPVFEVEQEAINFIKQ
jgi:anti-anti-sigma factor